MSACTPSMRNAILSFLSVLTIAAAAHGQVNGFGDFSNFTTHEVRSAPHFVESTSGGGSIDLIGGEGAQFANILFNTPQNVTQFRASFNYSSVIVSGAALGEFLLANTPAGSNYTGGIVSFSTTDAHTAAFLPPNGLEISAAANSGQSISPSTVLTGGGGITDLADPLLVSINYDGSVLQETTTDTLTSGFVTDTFAVNLPVILGGNTAYVGFAASSGQNSHEDFSNFQFTTSVPEPASLSILGATFMAALARRPRGNSRNR